MALGCASVGSGAEVERRSFRAGGAPSAWARKPGVAVFISKSRKKIYYKKKGSHRPLDLAVYLLYKFSCFGERVFLLCFHLFFGVEVGCREDMSHLRGTVKTARRLRQNSPMDRLAVIRTYTSVWIACVFWYGSAAVWIGPGYGSGCAFLVPDLPGGPASMRGQRALPDLKCELRISVGTPQPRNRMSE